MSDPVFAEQMTTADVVRECMQRFKLEWAVDETQLRAATEAGGGQACIHIDSEPGAGDVLGFAALGTPILKSAFLRHDHGLRKLIVGHYRALGYAWVNIVCLNRSMWKIFLFKADAHQPLGVHPGPLPAPPTGTTSTPIAYPQSDEKFTPQVIDTFATLQNEPATHTNWTTKPTLT